jgi:allantoicase
MEHRHDLASRRLGGGVVAASDESFGEKEHLLNPAPADWEPGRFGPRGEIVDGWETRRRRSPGHDWAIVRLGTPGRIRSVDVDTSFFTGNFPSQAGLEACGLEGYPGPAELAAADWVPLVPRSELAGDAHNVFAVDDERRWTHVRLSIHPDGGVARLRVHGEVVPDPRRLDGIGVDLLSPLLGAEVLASSDDFYSGASALILPDLARTMGEGWETRRRRDGGHDWVLFRLGAAGLARQVEVDTRHFVYNASAEFALSLAGSAPDDDDIMVEVLPRTPLQPDTAHWFRLDDVPARYARFDVFPDGGISRLRLPGVLTRAARTELGLAWFAALPAGQALDVLAGLPGAPEAVRLRDLVAARPFESLGAAGEAWAAMAGSPAGLTGLLGGR